MIKEAIEKIISLTPPKTYEIGGDTYTIDSNMRRIEPYVPRPHRVDFTSLDSIVQVLKTEVCRDEITRPLFVDVSRHNLVSVFTTYRSDNMGRDVLYRAEPCLPHPFSTWSEHDDAIIMLKSKFIPNDDTEYLLDILSRISKEDSVSSEDNGVSQKVTATQGIFLKTYERIKPRVTLAPFRTFLEVEQPESEFVLRLEGEKDKPVRVGIIEADGGAWKLKAKKNIADYFRSNLSELISAGAVVVTE